MSKLALPFVSSLALVMTAGLAAAQVPAGYPADYAQTIDAAKKEGKVVVYGTTDAAAANFLVKDFEALYGIKVEYNDLNSTELYNRFIAEAAAGQGTADVTWSSAQDLQIKLVNDGYASAYKTPEAAKIPSWANYKDSAYGVTYEPVAIVYNKRLVPADDVPKTHADLLKLLQSKPDFYKGKVTAYDPERSGVGYLFFTQDDMAWKQAWDLFKAFGKTEIKLYTSAGAMIERTTSGEHLIGYGVFGSYALSRSKKDPNIGIVLPKDYTLIASRVAFLSNKAKNPNAGKLFLDYLLSKRGQTIIANQAELYSLRDDVEGEATVAKVKEQVGDAIRPIQINGDLAANLDTVKRLKFLKQWQAAMKGQ
ncbi:iron ABC transporter substrate-binding protein [Alsobacter soli]|uniref:Iron ABC transporter substrate-binding protein n=1 Tax=Alsobacter soli TaxID=2109933 RepID=A0A2T1HYW2_9HYPH|nr:ABC transporter substrate-binding protein [Alsobacter soli]PSC06877.1 iron ABC transporter substrate-binding protein [Alsobacter soli]